MFPHIVPNLYDLFFLEYKGINLKNDCPLTVIGIYTTLDLIDFHYGGKN